MRESKDAGAKSQPELLVCLVRTLFNGETTREWMSPFEAAVEALTGTQNGLTVKSCHIVGDMAGWDMSYVPTFHADAMSRNQLA
jgi:hypothetical protein